MKRLVLPAILIFLLAACSGRKPALLAPDAPPDNVPNIIGEYALNGVDFYGQEYGGRLSIQPGAADGEYKLIWIVTGYIQEGVGALEGNRLAVAWRTIQGPIPGLRGTATYTVTVKGELHGTRKVEGYEGEEIETAYPNP